MNGHDFAAALRRMADWYEEHPDAPVPAVTQLNAFLDSREEFVQVARLIGSAGKGALGDWFWLVKSFDGISVEFNIRRGEVCERRVVGKRIVPATEEREEEIVEWDCSPIFAAAGETNAAPGAVEPPRVTGVADAGASEGTQSEPIICPSCCDTGCDLCLPGSGE